MQEIKLCSKIKQNYYIKCKFCDYKVRKWRGTGRHNYWRLRRHILTCHSKEFDRVTNWLGEFDFVQKLNEERR